MKLTNTKVLRITTLLLTKLRIAKTKFRQCNRRSSCCKGKFRLRRLKLRTLKMSERPRKQAFTRLGLPLAITQSMRSPTLRKI